MIRKEEEFQPDVSSQPQAAPAVSHTLTDYTSAVTNPVHEQRENAMAEFAPPPHNRPLYATIPLPNVHYSRGGDSYGTSVDSPSTHTPPSHTMPLYSCVPLPDTLDNRCQWDTPEVGRSACHRGEIRGYGCFCAYCHGGLVKQKMMEARP